MREIIINVNEKLYISIYKRKINNNKRKTEIGEAKY